MKTKDILNKLYELECRWKFDTNNDLEYHMNCYTEWEKFREKEWTENE